MTLHLWSNLQSQKRKNIYQIPAVCQACVEDAHKDKEDTGKHQVFKSIYVQPICLTLKLDNYSKKFFFIFVNSIALPLRKGLAGIPYIAHALESKWDSQVEWGSEKGTHHLKNYKYCP